MGDFVKINPNSKKGDLLVSKEIFAQIAVNAVDRIKEAKVASNKNSKGVQVSFLRNGKAKIVLPIKVEKGSKAEDVASRVEDVVSTALFAYVEAVPFEIEVVVEEIR